MILDKQKVTNQFRKSRETYEKEALVQRQVIDVFVKELLETKRINFNNVMEIGCGTGLLTRQLIRSLECSNYYLNDLDLMQLGELTRNCIWDTNLPVWHQIEGDAFGIFPNLSCVMSTNGIEVP